MSIDHVHVFNARLAELNPLLAFLDDDISSFRFDLFDFDVFIIIFLVLVIFLSLHHIFFNHRNVGADIGEYIVLEHPPEKVELADCSFNVLAAIILE
jgi:hypothetical protein